MKDNEGQREREGQRQRHMTTCHRDRESARESERDRKVQRKSE